MEKSLGHGPGISLNFIPARDTCPRPQGTEHRIFQHPPHLGPADLEFGNASMAHAICLSHLCSTKRKSPPLRDGVIVSDCRDETRYARPGIVIYSRTSVSDGLQQ